MKKFIKLNCLFILLVLLSCSPKIIHSGYYSFESECLGIELDGSQTLKAWGRGKNRKDAVEQAKKNAVRDVIFKGIRKGSPECNLKPILVEVNAHERHEDYFNAFFADDGPYKDFITNDDRAPVEKHLAGNDLVCGVTVRVLRSDLKKQLEGDSILK
ncbi:hypothetical protein [uncultured Draconibacterium sp.]|uniref:hypothetical protein n=1 Tax=uncultured Draconibacterium sp. TaxID=1573823 RepID=UPI0029C65FD1|nr:hypothetical protein [uncultured Draconibacterium sp.]